MSAKKDILLALEAVIAEYGGHIPHEGRAWSKCLACRLERTIRDLRDGDILMPTRDVPEPLKDITGCDV